MTTASENPSLTVVGGRYRLVTRVAGGGMGDVWRARDDRLGRDVAVKLLKSHLADDDIFRERFRFEARAAAALNHPSIAAVFDYGEEPDSKDGYTAYLVMEFVEGEPLEQHLRRRNRIDPITTLGIVEQTAAGLQAAHERGIVHRDIKPANLMVRPDGTIKITDFGIARALDSAQLTQTGTMLGTVEYMSPEQLEGRTATAKSDLYALGVVAYRCLAGRTPFGGPESMAVALAHIREPVPRLPTDVPAAVAGLVYQMLEKDPSHRPASALRLAEDAVSVSHSLGPSAVVSSPEPSVRARPTGIAPTTVVAPGGVSVAREETQSMLTATASYPRVPEISKPSEVRPSQSKRGAQSRKRRGFFVAAVVILLGMLIFWAASGPGPVTVPDVHGLPVGAASGRMTTLGLRVSVRSTDAASSAGTVLTQRPSASSRVAPGSTVMLTVASGFVDVDPAALIGQPVARADALLAGLGLNALSEAVISLDAPGTVVSAVPSGRVRTGSSVTLGVAVAAPPPTTTTTTTTTPGKGGTKPTKPTNGPGGSH